MEHILQGTGAALIIMPVLLIAGLNYIASMSLGQDQDHAAVIVWLICAAMISIGVGLIIGLGGF